MAKKIVGDLISRNALLSTLPRFEKDRVGYPLNGGISYAKIQINAAPSVDVVEVVHGRWVVNEADSGDPGCYSAYIEVQCSECGYSLGAESGQYGWYDGDPFPLNFCPNCGAKMDGDNHENP